MQMDVPLIGHWERRTESSCSRVYPLQIEFRAQGLYTGTGMQPGDVPGWDNGTWRIIEPGQVRISTNNDAQIIYQFSIQGDVLTFLDSSGCKFEYRRVGERS